MNTNLELLNKELLIAETKVSSLENKLLNAKLQLIAIQEKLKNIDRAKVVEFNNKLKRAYFVKVARQILKYKPIQAFGLNDVAAASKYSRTTIYNICVNKETLILLVATEMLLELRQLLDKNNDNKKIKPRAMFLNIVETENLLYKEERNYFLTIFTACEHSNRSEVSTEINDELDKSLESIITYIDAIVSQALTEKSLILTKQADSRFVAEYLFNLIFSASFIRCSNSEAHYLASPEYFNLLNVTLNKLGWQGETKYPI